jgi:hypothetical protein
MREKLNEIYVAAGVDVPASETGETIVAFVAALVRNRACETGRPDSQLKKLMGHEEVETTMKYVTVTDADLESAVDWAGGSWQWDGSERASNVTVIPRRKT